MKMLIFVLIILFPFFMFAATLYVGAGQTYITISDAVTAAVEGDTVLVHDGTYTENVDINISLTLISQNGYETTFITTPINWEDIVDINADNVIMDGFSLYGATHNYGVHFNACSNGLIQNCRSGWSSEYTNLGGVYVTGSNNIIIRDNICSYNNNVGIYAHGSQYITISNNICNYCQHPSYSGISGIMMYATTNCQIHNNICNYNDIGIDYEYNSGLDTITGNECRFNNEYGFYGYAHDRLYISDNVFSDNFGSGARIRGVHDVFVGNKFESNTNFGIVMYYCQDLTFYLNTFNNTNNFDFHFGASYPDPIYKTPTKMAYRTNATTFKNYLGNYYNDYTGADADSDGIGDTAHAGTRLNDNYPLMSPPENYGLLTWFLNKIEMHRNDPGTIGGVVNIPESSSHVWIANEPVMDGLTFPAGLQADSTSWTGQMVYEYNSHPDMLIEIGIWDGSSFTPGGPQTGFVGNNAYYPQNYATTENSFTVPLGQFLAMRTTVNNTDRDFDFKVGGTWAYISAPIGSPDYPGCPLGIPELTIDVVSSEEFTYVQLDWEDVDCASSYNIYSCDNPYGEYTFIENISETSWIEFIEEDEARKFYRVTANN